MEDVVLHYKPGSADVTSSLLERTEKLLEPFPCRTPPVFTPWFPGSATERRLPIRPAKPAPVILSSDELPGSNTQQQLAAVTKPPSCAEIAPETPQKNKDPVFVSETPDQVLPVRESRRPTAEKRPQEDRDVSAVKRSWSVFTQRGVLLQSSQSPSTQFDDVVSIHRLHLRQRAKWVISEQNCGVARDMEQVWRTLSRSVQSSRLPTCNANIQRERAEIWVFCDVLYCEQVGRVLKEELQLSGRISLSVHRLGNIFSM
ncbi:shieldin complex subunit 3 [Parambassis ranga]|uniref:Shieldin complex subunit 3 n=1 Tax=Parambassis ranga TaxID=210632 RepID=A0A6P7J0M7_9TELE|nr:shieldin complex subunit 3-like [Parambassis ranga]